MLSSLLEMHHCDDKAIHDAHAAEFQSRLAFAFAEPNSSMRNIAEFLAERGIISLLMVSEPTARARLL